MVRTLRTLLVVALLGIPTSVPAALAEVDGPPTAAAPDGERAFDARRPVASARTLAAAELRARAELSRSLGQAVFDLDPRTGTVRVLARLDGFLTSPSDDPARAIALRYVRRNRTALGLSSADLSTFVFVRGYEDLDGTRHLSWVQRADGVEAFDSGLKASVTADGRLVTISGSPAHGLGRGVPSTRPAIAAAGAVAAARAGRGGAASIQPRDTARVVWFHGARSTLAWQTLTYVSGSRVDLSVVDASTGSVLWRANVVTADQIGTGLAWESYPSTAVANGGGMQQEVTFPVKGSGRLAGNNAHVYLDVNDDNRAGSRDEIASSVGLDWSEVADLNTTRDAQNCKPVHACTWNRAVPRSWKANRAQGAVQTYYYLNRFHDHLLAAPIGFTEAAGNFQAQNMGGGRDGDAVQGQVFDGAATDGGLPDRRHYNNANMFTPPDGRAPTMQLYLFREDRFARGWPSGNAGDDAAIVYHEYTHGLSNRLVTYPNGWGALFQQQSGAMGEAWSDWYALDLLVEEGWEPDTNASGEVKAAEYITGRDGIRFQAIDCSVGAGKAVCPPGVRTGAGGFTYGDYGDVLGFAEVHSDGEIWAQTLWDLRERLGVDLARALVTRGMMLSPPEPSFLDVRNAIVQADRVANGGANADAIWKVFARRGMGYFASTLSSADVHPIESFKTAPDCGDDPCGTLKGIVRGEDGGGLGGAVVGLAGLTTGFPGANLWDVSRNDGRFAIANVPFGTYRGLVVDRRGYDLLRDGVTVNQAKERIVLRPVRDWAAADGGARIRSFTGPDYTQFGCGPRGAIDRSLFSGWGSRLPVPRELVIELARTIDVSSFGVDPGEICGDLPSAATRTFAIFTRTANGPWVLAWTQTSGLESGRLHRIVPRAGSRNVRFVKIELRSNRDARDIFVDLAELSVRGTPS